MTSSCKKRGVTSSGTSLFTLNGTNKNKPIRMKVREELYQLEKEQKQDLDSKEDALKQSFDNNTDTKTKEQVNQYKAI